MVELTSLLAPLKHILQGFSVCELELQNSIGCNGYLTFDRELEPLNYHSHSLEPFYQGIRTVFFSTCVSREVSKFCSLPCVHHFFCFFPPLLVEMSYLHSECGAWYTRMQLRSGNHRDRDVLRHLGKVSTS